MKRNGRKGGGNLEGLLMFGDALPPELVAGAKALGMGGGMGALLAEGASGVGADDGGEEKAPDAIDFEDMSDGEVDDFLDDEPAVVKEVKQEKEEDAEEVRAKAAEMARALKSKLGAGAAKQGGDDYDDDYDTDTSSLPSITASLPGRTNGPSAAPSITTTTSASTATPLAVFVPPLPVKQEVQDGGGMGLDEMEKALFSDDDDDESINEKEAESETRPKAEENTDDDMDEDLDSKKSVVPLASLPAGTTTTAASADAGPVLPPAIAAVLSGSAIVLTPSVKHICSSLYNGMEGPILKFSEIFAPRRPNKRSRLRQAARARARAAAAAAAASVGQAEEEEDEEDLFNTLSYTFYLPKEEVSDDDDYEEAGETDVVVDESSPTAATESAALTEMKRKKKEKKRVREDVTFVPIPSPVHEAVQTWPWEDEIIWENPESSAKAHATKPVPQQSAVALRASVSESDAAKTSTASSPPHADVKAGVWGAIASPEGNVKPAAAATESSASEVLEQLEEEPVVEPREWSLFPAINTDLASGDWLDAVVWDDRKVPSAAVNNPLIFDLNDKEMLFEENVKKPLDDEEQIVEEEGEKKVERRRGRRPKRKISEIANIIEDEVEEDLDPFNYSLDRIYANASRALAKIRPKNMGKPVVQHSIPALKLSSFKTNFTPDDLRLFHRPRTRVATSKKIKITPSPIEGSRTNPRFKKQSGTIRRKRELSGKDGRVILTEYLEERPPVLSNVGMGTKILNYYRKKDANDIPADKTREDGDMVLLDEADECPFLGEVPTGDTVQMMDNNLFRAPVVKHNAATTDFLLVRAKGNKFYIREIPALYAVGQEQPVTEVPAPNSRSANNFIKSRLQTFIYRLFKKRANQQRVRISDICSAFPSHSETSIRKRLKDCSDFQRGGDDSGWWTLKKDFEMPSEEDLRAMLTPETVCAYESMLAGHQRLQDCGIEHTHNATGLSQAVAQLEAESGKKHKAAAAFVKEEVYLAPWNTTGNFLSVQNGKGQLQLTGFGDPTGTGAGFSYLRVPQKVQAKQKKAQVPKTSVTGTDADLRKLSLENARLVLLKFGVSEDVIEKLGRWERIDLVREKSSAAVAGGDDPNLTKFARGRRVTFQQQQQVYKDECARIFEKQLAFLSALDPDDISDDEEDLQDNIELQDFAGEMERELEALFGDDSLSEAPELPPPKAARGASRPAAGVPRALGRKKTLAQQEADEEEAERRELQKFMEEAREKKREEALASVAAAATPARPAPVAVTPATTPSATVAKPATPVTPTPAPAAEAKRPEPVREPFSPFSDSSLDGYASSDSSLPGGSPRPPTEGGEAKKTTRKFIKRTVTKKGPDGQPIKVVEIIRDPKKVEEYMKKSKAAKKNRPKLTVEEEAEKQRVRKEKRRLQEQLRRLKKNREKQRILAERLAEGNRDGTLSQTEGTNNQLVCGACGMVGHMRTNRNCPYYTEDQAAVVTKGTGPRKGKRRRRNVDYDEDDDDDEDDFDLDDDLEDYLDEPLLLDELLAAEEAELAAKVAPLVKVEGTKLRFPKVVLAAVTPTATPTTSIPASPISVIDVTPPPAPSAVGLTPAAVEPAAVSGTTSRRPSKRPKVESISPRASAPTTPAPAPAVTPAPPTPSPVGAPARAAAPATPAAPVSSHAATTPAAEPSATPGGGEKKLILRISKKDLPPGALTRKRPASELSEPNYMLNPPKASRVRRKTGRGAGVQLAAIFEKAMLRVKSHEYAPPFLRPVTPKEAPDYHKYIKKPIDLGTIHNNVKTFKYLSQNAFMADMKLMASNCHKYCETRFPQLPLLADTLVKICTDALRENETEIQELEALINAEGGEGDDTPAPPTPAPTPSRPRSSGGSGGHHKSAAAATTPYTPKSTTPAPSGSRSSRPSSKTTSRSTTPRSTTPSSSVPASPSASFHFSSSPSSPVHSSSVPRVTSAAGSTKVKIKLPSRVRKEDS